MARSNQINFIDPVNLDGNIEGARLIKLTSQPSALGNPGSLFVYSNKLYVVKDGATLIPFIDLVTGKVPGSLVDYNDLVTGTNYVDISKLQSVSATTKFLKTDGSGVDEETVAVDNDIPKDYIYHTLMEFLPYGKIVFDVFNTDQVSDPYLSVAAGGAVRVNGNYELNGGYLETTNLLTELTPPSTGTSSKFAIHIEYDGSAPSIEYKTVGSYTNITTSYLNGLVELDIAATSQMFLKISGNSTIKSFCLLYEPKINTTTGGIDTPIPNTSSIPIDSPSYPSTTLQNALGALSTAIISKQNLRAAKNTTTLVLTERKSSRPEFPSNFLGEVITIPKNTVQLNDIFEVVTSSNYNLTLSLEFSNTKLDPRYKYRHGAFTNTKISCIDIVGNEGIFLFEGTQLNYINTTSLTSFHIRVRIDEDIDFSVFTDGVSYYPGTYQARVVKY